MRESAGWTRSRSLHRRAQETLPGGVTSPFRATLPQTLYFADAEGARLRDVDGNRYIDFALAWGPLILGHKHPCMVDALTNDELIHEAPAIVGCQTPSALAHAGEVG